MSVEIKARLERLQARAEEHLNRELTQIEKCYLFCQLTGEDLKLGDPRDNDLGRVLAKPRYEDVGPILEITPPQTFEGSMDVDFVKWSLTDSKAKEWTSKDGIFIYNLQFAEALDLDFISIDFQLNFINCTFSEGISMHFAKMKTLNFNNSTTKRIEAYGMRISGDLMMRNGFVSQGKIDFSGSVIEGDVECIGCQLHDDSIAFALSRSRIRGTVHFTDVLVTKGTVEATDSIVNGNMHFRDVLLSNKSKNDDVQSAHSANCTLRIAGTKIIGDLVLGSLDKDPDLAKVSSRIAGILDARNAIIHGNVLFRNAEFSFPNHTTLNLNRIKITGHLSFDKACKIIGNINLISAKIEGKLEFTSINPASKIEEIDLRSAIVDTYSDTRQLWDATDKFFLHGFQYNRLDNTENCPISAEDRKEWLKKDHIELKNFARKTKLQWLLNFLKWAMLADLWSRKNWSITRWISTKDFQTTITQSYHQLASFYKSVGLDDDYKTILIRRNDQAMVQETNWKRFLYKYFTRVTLAYGYKPFYAIKYFILFIGLGFFFTLFFHEAFGLFYPSYLGVHGQAFTEYKSELPKGYTSFCPFNYTLDTFIPLVELFQNSHWSIHTDTEEHLVFEVLTIGRIAYFVFVTLSLVGWILTTAFVIGLTGILKE